MADSYLDESGYPIKNPNMKLDLPNPNPQEEITGVDVNVSSSQAPAPETQNVNVDPVIEPEEANPFSIIAQQKMKEDTATAAALKDTQNLVKYIHAKKSDDVIDEETQDHITMAVENIIGNRMKRGGRLIQDLMHKEGFKNDYSFLNVKNDNTFVSTSSNYALEFKENAKNSLSKRGYSINNDKGMIKALSEEFDKNEKFFIGDKAMNIPNQRLFGDVSWLEGTVWADVFDADTKELYTNLITDVNKHIINNANVSDKDGKKIFMNYAKAVLTLDDSAYIDAVIDIENKTNTEMAAIISDKPVIDEIVRGFQLQFPDFFDYEDIEKDVSSQLDNLRRHNKRFKDFDWNSPDGDYVNQQLLELAGGDKVKANRYKEYMMDDEVLVKMFGENLAHPSAVINGMYDTFRHFTSADGVAFMGGLAATKPLLTAAFKYTAPLWAGAVAEPTLYGEVAAGVATMGVFLGLATHGTYQSIKGLSDVRTQYDEGELSSYDYTYQQTVNGLGLLMSGAIGKHGANTKVKYSTFKGRDGKTYTLPTSETAWDYVARSVKPNYRLKQPALISENVNNYIYKINAKHYKNFAEFETAFVKDVNVPAKLKEPGMAKEIFQNAKIMEYQGYGFQDSAVPQIETITGKKLDNVTFDIIEPSPKYAESYYKNQVKDLKSEIETLNSDLNKFTEIKQKGTGQTGVAGLSATFKNEINIKNVTKKIEQKNIELESANKGRIGEIEVNKQMRSSTQKDGDLIIESDYRTNVKDWAYIRVSKDGKIHIGELPSGIKIEGGEINYFSVKGDKVPGVLKETPVNNSMVERYTGKKLDKSGHGALNGLLTAKKIMPEYGDVAGAKDEYVYTGSQYGWRNLKEDNAVDVFNWFEKLEKMDKDLFTGGKMVDYYNQFKTYTSKFPGKDLAPKPGKGRGKFEQPVDAGNIYTAKPNQKLFEVSEEIKLNNLKDGIFVEDSYITINGNEPWFPKLQQKLAESFDKLEHKSDYAPMVESYNAFTKELPKAYEILKKNGFEVELWKGKGEPYKNSAEMHKDMAKGHLYIRQTTTGFGPVENMNITVNEFIEAQNLPEKFMVSGKMGKEPTLNAKGEFHPVITELFPMLKQSGLKTSKGEQLTYNDLFRAIHDFTHHGKSGNGFGPKGEFQGFIDGLSIFSEAAHPALFSETAMQNAFFNTFGRYADQRMVWAPKLLSYVKSKIIKPKDNSFMVEKTSPMVSRKVFKTFIKESDRFNYQTNGNKWGVIANEITDIKGVEFILNKIGKKDINFHGYSLKKHLNKIKDLKPEEIAKINRKFLDDFIVSAGKEGRTIHRANTKGWYENNAENGNFLTGDITATELQTISLFFGQKSFLNNFGEVFSYSPQINNFKYKVTDHKPPTSAYTEITTADGHIAYIAGKRVNNSNNVSSVVEHMDRFGEFDATNTNFFSSAKDMANWRERFGSKGDFPVDPITQEVSLGAKNRLALEKEVLEKGHLTIDWANINDPINVKMMQKMYQNGKKVNFRYYDESTNKMLETEVKYVFDSKTNYSKRWDDFIDNAQVTWKNGDFNKIDAQAMKDGFNKKIITTKQMPIVEGDPVKPNKGLTVNHMGNINLSKLPRDSQGVLRTLLDEIGDKGYTEFVRKNIGHEQQVALALEPKNFENLINRILIDGHNNGAYLKNGDINTMVRTNPTDVIGAQFLLVEMINKYTANPSPALGNIIKKVAGANHVIRSNAGRTLNAMQIEINGGKVNIDNLTMLGKDELSAVYSIFSESEPATIMQKIVEFRRNNLLSAASSLTRSMAGNTFNLAIQMPNKLLSGAINEALTYFDHGIRGGKWDPLANRKASDALHFTEGFFSAKGMPNLLKDILFGKEAAIAEQAIAINEGWYSKPRIGGKAGKIITTPQRLQVLLDAMVRKPSENGFLHEFAHRIAKSEKLSGKEYKSRVQELIANPDANMVRQAKTSSEYITFQEQLGTWGKMFNRIRTGKGTEGVQLIFPFFNTSVNLMKVGYNMTPLGLATPKYFKAAKEGFSKGNWGAFSDQTARVAVGTTVMWWMNQMMGDGQYNYEGDWAEEEKPVRELKEKLGYQPNSIWWENRDGEIESFSTVGFEPLASIMNISATWKKNEDENFQDRSAAVLKAWIKQFKENPFMQGTDDLLDLVEGLTTGGERGKDPVTYFNRLLLSSAIPNFIMQGGKIKDDIRYENPYREKWRVDELDNWYNSLLTEFRYIDNTTAVPKVNLFGEPVRIPDPVGATLALRNIKGEQNNSYNAVANEIIRLAPELGDMSFEIKNYKQFLQLTPKQAFLLEVAAGREFFKTLEDKLASEYVMEDGVVKVDENNYFVKSKSGQLTSSWSKLPDAAKIKTIKTIQSSVKKAQLFGIAPELFKKGEYGDYELIDPKEFVVYKEGRKDKGFEETKVIREELTKRYKESKKGELEIAKAEKYANQIIVLMRRGMDKGEAIDNILNKIKE